MPRFAMDWNDDLRPNPIVHLLELRPPWVAGNMDVRLTLSDDLHAEVRKLVHNPADADLVAGDDPRRENDRVAFAEFQLVVACRDPAQRSSRFALTPGRNDQHLIAWQTHCLVEGNRRREIA